MRRIYLIGPRACGKTTVGRALAEALGAEFRDTDEELLRRLGRSVADFVAAEGWERFRDEERLALAALVEDTSGEGTAVVSTGGGIVLREENRRLMRATGVCVRLDAPAEVLAARLAADPDAAQRPSLTGLGLAEEVARVVAERAPLYAACAHLAADATLPAREIALALAGILGEDPPQAADGPTGPSAAGTPPRRGPARSA